MWKDIEDWEEFYEINEDGDVRNKQTGHLVIGDRNSGSCWMNAFSYVTEH